MTFSFTKKMVCKVVQGSVEVRDVQTEAANDRRNRAYESAHVESRSRRPRTNDQAKVTVWASIPAVSHWSIKK
jgi:hypothetical protein